METRYKVRIKTKVKVRLIATMTLIVLPLALFGLYLFEYKTPQVEIRNHFPAEVIEFPKWSAPKIGKGIYSKYVGYPYYAAVNYKGETYGVGSFKPLYPGTKVCIGAVVKGDSNEVINYVNVDLSNCSYQTHKLARWDKNTSRGHRAFNHIATCSHFIFHICK